MAKIKLEVKMGDIIIELDEQQAPITSKNFIEYVNDDFFTNTLFHRVIDSFMIQGGGLEKDMTNKPNNKPSIQNEANNGLKNKRGTIAMARTAEPHSASSQFFINLVDNDFLNFKAETHQGWGYAVFGKVIEGMDIVDKIAKVKTASKNGHQNVPVDQIIINKVSLI